MNRRNGLLAAFMACLLALGVALVGCGGAGGGGADAGKAAFVGTWDLVEMEDEDGSVTDEEQISSLSSLGLEVYLELNEDGSAKLMLFGTEMEGTWTASSATAGKITLEDQAVDMTIADDKLTMTQEGEKLTFKKGEAHTGESSSGDADAEDDADAETQEAQEPITFDEPVTIADDDVCTIVATGKRDYLGDPAVVISVVNKTDKTLYITSETGSFSVAGKQLDPIIGTTVGAGETDDEVEVWFEADDLGSTKLEDLKDVTGTIEVWDDSTNETLGSYAMTVA